MKVTFFANIYPPLIGSCGHVYDSRELADQMAARTRLVCVEFIVEMPEVEGDHASEDSKTEE
jgi:hypothetical protein